jgi:hypothetical protein
MHRESLMPCRRLIALTLLAVSPRAMAAQSNAVLVGVVTAKTNGQPIPYADVTVEPRNVSAFTDAQGRFRFVSVPTGTVRLTVRRLGFRPGVTSVVLSGDRTDSVRVVLAELALNLEKVQVSENVCPTGGDAVADTAVVAILEQVQINAGRSAMFAREFPFEMESERIFADELRDGPRLTRVRKRTVIGVDTIQFSGARGDRYVPGKLIVPTFGDSPVDAAEKLIVPQLADFADERFVATHCFRYAGGETIDEHKVVRVDFEPIESFRSTDVRGSLYLNAESFAIHRSTLLLERASPKGPSGERWEIRVDTWFRDFPGGLSTVDRIVQTTTIKSADAYLRSQRVAVEEQRTIALRFPGPQPGEPDRYD